MSTTTGSLVEFGRKANIDLIPVSIDSNEPQAVNADIIIRRDSAGSQIESLIYTKINFNNKMKRALYKKINELLGEG